MTTHHFKNISNKKHSISPIISKKIFFLIFSLILNLNGFSQENSFEKDKVLTRKGNKFIQPKNAIIKDTLFVTYNDIEPRFLDCDHFANKEIRGKCFSEIFYETIRKKIKFKDSWFHTKTIKFDLVFVINKVGKIENITFAGSNDENHKFEKEMLRVLKKMPEILPGIKNGKAVKVKYKFPFKFNLPE